MNRMKGTIIVKVAHCINWKNKSFFCLIDLIRKNQTIKVDLICMVRCLKKNCIFYYWLQMTWILELSGQQRIIILENLNWLTQLGTNLNPILHYPSIYTEWKIGLIQYCAKFEQFCNELETFLLTLNIYQPVLNEYFLCTMYYIIPKLGHCLERICLKRICLKISHSYVVQKPCLFVRTPPPLLLKYNCYSCNSTH